MNHDVTLANPEIFHDCNCNIPNFLRHSLTSLNDLAFIVDDS
ncbi:Unknown protein sequence [Pseudomonas syringae pv. maculicola]|nr:Unknown protein sequence [Pseudomonas syringae pv. maculicola]